MLYSDLLKSCLVLCKNDESLVLALFELSNFFFFLEGEGGGGLKDIYGGYLGFNYSLLLF